MRQIAVVLAAVRLGHQHADVASDHFLEPVAEHGLDRWIAGQHDSGRIDGNHTVDQVVGNRRSALALIFQAALDGKGACGRAQLGIEDDEIHRFRQIVVAAGIEAGHQAFLVVQRGDVGCFAFKGRDSLLAILGHHHVHPKLAQENLQHQPIGGRVIHHQDLQGSLSGVGVQCHVGFHGSRQAGKPFMTVGGGTGRWQPRCCHCRGNQEC